MGRGCLNLRPTRERLWDSRDRQGERGSRIGKDEYRKLEPCFLDQQRGIRDVSITLLLLQLSLDDIGMSSFASGLSLLREGGKACGLL